MAADSGFCQFSARPRILVTRPLEVGEDQSFEQSLTSVGFVVCSVPLIEVATQAFPPFHRNQYDWVFFTSKNAVKAVGFQIAANPDEGLSVACVGPATEQALKPYGLEAQFVSPVYDARNAVEYFAARYPVTGLRILWPCGNLADSHLKTALEAQGALVTAVTVYETRLKCWFSDQEKQALTALFDLVVFTSPSAVQAFQQNVINGGILSELRGAIACLGPRTAQAALKTFGRVDIQAEPYTLDALSLAIRQYCQTQEPI